MARLLSTVEVYRVDTEDQVAALIEDAKHNATDYTLVTHSSKYKEKKKKGVVVDAGYEVKLGKVYEQFWPEDL